MIHIQQVLAPLDLSDMSTTVLAHASSLTNMWGARLLLVHVVPDLPTYPDMSLDLLPFEELQQSRETEARARLRMLCDTILDGKLPYEIRVTTGHPVAEICRIVQEQGIDCLVLGAHRDEKREQSVLGSTAERLLHLMPCLIVIVPSSDHTPW